MGGLQVPESSFPAAPKKRSLSEKLAIWFPSLFNCVMGSTVDEVQSELTDSLQGNSINREASAESLFQLSKHYDQATYGVIVIAPFPNTACATTTVTLRSSTPIYWNNAAANILQNALLSMACSGLTSASAVPSLLDAFAAALAPGTVDSLSALLRRVATSQKCILRNEGVNGLVEFDTNINACSLPTQAGAIQVTQDSASHNGGHLQTLDMEPILLFLGSAAPEVGDVASAVPGCHGNGRSGSCMPTGNDGGNNYRRPCLFSPPVQEQRPSCWKRTTFNPPKMFAAAAKRERLYQVDAPCSVQPAVIVTFSAKKPNGGALLHRVDDPTIGNNVFRTVKPWPAVVAYIDDRAVPADGGLGSHPAVLAPATADYRQQQAQQQSSGDGGRGSAPQAPVNSSAALAAAPTLTVVGGSCGLPNPNGAGKEDQNEDVMESFVRICGEATPGSSDCNTLNEQSPSGRRAAAALDDEGGSLWFRREGIVLSALTQMVTAVTVGCASVLYQNALSLSYYGPRSRPKAPKAPSRAWPQDGLADGSEPGCIDTSGTFLLTQLFSLQSGKLERMLADVMGEARIWKGIVQVPVSAKLEARCSSPTIWYPSFPFANQAGCQAGSTVPWAAAGSCAPDAAAVVITEAVSSSVGGVTPSSMAKAAAVGPPNSSLASRHCSSSRALRRLDSATFPSKARRPFLGKPSAPVAAAAGDGIDTTVRSFTGLYGEAIRTHTSTDFLIAADENPNAMMEASTRRVQNSLDLNPLATSTWGLMLDTMEDSRLPAEIPNRQLNSSQGRCTVEGLASRNVHDIMAGFAAKATAAAGVAAAATIATPTGGSATQGSPTRFMRAPVIPSTGIARKDFCFQDNGVLGFITASQLPFDTNGRSSVCPTVPSPTISTPNPHKTCNIPDSNTDASGHTAELLHQDSNNFDLIRRTKSMLVLAYGCAAGTGAGANQAGDNPVVLGTPRRCITRADLHGPQSTGPQRTATRVLAFASSLKNTPSALQQALAVMGTNVPGPAGVGSGVVAKQVLSLPNADYVAVCNEEGGQNDEAAGPRIESCFAPRAELRMEFIKEFLSSSDTLQPRGPQSGATAQQMAMAPLPAVAATATVSTTTVASAAGAPPPNPQRGGPQGAAVPAAAAIAISARSSGRRLADAAAATVATSGSVAGNNISVGRQEQLHSSPTNNNASVAVSVCSTAAFAVGSSMPSAASTLPISCAPEQVLSSSCIGGMTAASVHGAWRTAMEEAAAAAVRGTASSRSRSPLGQMTAAATVACWHEITAVRTTDPVSGQDIIVLVQSDVTDKVEAERHLARVAEAEHRLLEKIFPRHVLTYMMTEEGVLLDPAPPSSRPGSHRPAPLIRDINKLATSHSEVTLLFADIQGFTPMCQMLEPHVVMTFLNDLFTRFDNRLEEFGVYKVETIGDCYFVAGGLIHQDEHGMHAVRARDSHADPLHAEKVFMFAKAMLAAAAEVALPTTGGPVRMRIGIHTGPVVSGVVGQRMPRFCLFGDTVNTASRMESTGLPGCIHASEAARRLLPHESWIPTGGTEVKGKGLMNTYLWAPPDHHLHEAPRWPSAASRHPRPNGSVTEPVTNGSTTAAAAAAAAAASSATVSGAISGGASNLSWRVRQQISVGRAPSRWGSRVSGGSGGSRASALTAELAQASVRGTVEEGGKSVNVAYSGGGFAQVWPPRLSSDSATESVEGLAKLLLDSAR